jgi:hypothetical protein
MQASLSNILLAFISGLDITSPTNELFTVMLKDDITTKPACLEPTNEEF